MIALKAHFDGKVLVPDEPLALQPNQRVRITVEPIEPAPPGDPEPNWVFGLQKDCFVYVSLDFDEPLPDAFWLGDNEARP